MGIRPEGERKPTTPQAEAITFALEQNQPNPFKPATTIRYAIPTASDVTLAIYNVAGQMIRKLESGRREAGRYTVGWDGRDAAGARVSAGVYFYRLESAGETLTKKMTVLK